MHRIPVFVLSIAVTVVFSCQPSGLSDDPSGFADMPEISLDVSNLNIRAFYEDRYGHIWIGTDRGLNRYTGKEYFQYFNGDSPSTINNNSVYGFLENPDGSFWIATASGPAYYTDFDDFHRVEVDAEVGYRAPSRLIRLETGDIVMSNLHGALFCYDSLSDRFLPIHPSGGDVSFPISTMIFPGRGSCCWSVAQDCLYVVDCHDASVIKSLPYPSAGFHPSGAVMDAFSRLWLYDASRIYCVDTGKGTFVNPPAPVSDWLQQHSPVRLYALAGMLILQDARECWFYRFADGILVSQHDREAPYDLPAFRPISFFLDSQSHLWVGTNGHGLTVCSGQEDLFNRSTPLMKAFQDVNVKALDADRKDDLWVVATENRIFHATLDGHTVSFDAAPFLSSSFPSDQVELIRYDRSRDAVWLGTDAALFLCRSEGKGLHVMHRYALPSTPHVIECCSDAVYVGLSAGEVLKVNPVSQDCSIIPVAPGDHQIRDIRLLQNGKLVILSQMEDIKIYDPATGEMETIPYRDQLGELFHLMDVCEDAEGNLWFATRNYGVIMMSFHDKSFHFVPGTTCEWIQAIELDRTNHLWVSSFYGLNMILPNSEDIVRFYKEDGIGGNQFNVRASCSLSDGTIVFGGTHGITTCHQVSMQGQKPFPLYIEHLTVNGKAISPYPKGPVPESLVHSPRVTLRHNQNNLSVAFAGLDYPRSQTLLYQYKLEGYDSDWTLLGNDNRARFSSLPPGKYILRVNAQSLGSDPVYAALPIRIKPAPLASPVAFFFYFLFFGALAYIAIKVAKERVRLNLQLEQSEREKEHEQIVNKVNMNFFADMAHEFRSPLTMIKAPMSQLLEDRDVRPESHKLLQVMNLSVDRMVKLVNNLLNFNKLDNNKLTLAVERDYDIVARTLKILEMSGVSAARRGISLQTSGFGSPFRIPLDPDKYESILSNLMSNALKFAGNNGDSAWVGVHFEPGTEQVRIRIENSSRLFTGEELNRIFDRYYQVREHAEHAHLPGTGIGLNYAWMLAERMHGSLIAENLPDGSGVRFTLTLPAKEDAFRPEEFVRPAMRTVSGHEQESPVAMTEGEDAEDDSPKFQTILVVDDDEDIANYLSMLLSPYYNVEVANDVTTANNLIISKEMPDIILSDIVMPGEDGISFCKSVKGNILTCHIPVILVTAKVGVNNEVEGLESGADAYVTKPFDPVYILALIKSMLKNRSLLKGELAKSTSVAEVRGDLLSPRDSAFLEQLYKIMEEEMANPELDVQKICDKMCVSRTKLFYKVKSLTGMSAATIFRTFRLNMAAKMLREGNDNVSEVAYKVGFNSPSYFTRAFKAQFGVLPKDIAKS